MSTKRVLLLTVLCVTLLTRVSAQTYIGRQLADQFPSSPWGHTLNGLTWLPNDYISNPTQRYPLIIFLHGVGESGYGIGGLYSLLGNGLPAKIAGGWDPEAINPADGQNYKFITVSPQANVWSCEWSILQYILPDIISRYRVDTSRIYVTGLSAGGQATWTCVTSGPQAARKFAAIVPVSSANAIPYDSIPKVGSQYGVKLWQVCGDQDSFWGFVSASTSLYNNGVPAPTPQALLTPLPFIGHWGWNDVYDPAWKYNSNNPTGKNIYEWMLQYQRSPLAQSLAANAGPPQTITLPNNQVSLTGSGTAATGNTIASYTWTKISGPSTFTITSANTASTTITGLVQGNYIFRLTVTDNLGSGATSDVAINVLPQPNVAPVVSAGTDQSIQLPLSGVNLSGTATDPDGSIAGILWTKISGPASFTISTAWQAQTPVSGLTQGVYLFELSATDNSGATTRDTVMVTVLAAPPPPNQAPHAQAGLDQTITLPVNTVTLSGSGTDTDGWISNYSWTRISGPAQYTIINGNSAQTGVNNLLQGVYAFELTVTDNSGTNGKDTVLVTVLPAPPPANILPIAHAGADVILTLPVNSTTLQGSGSDTDGTISGYQWTKISGPSSFTINTATQAQTVLGNLVQGTYQFELTVTDNNGGNGKDTVNVSVLPAPPPNNNPPTAHAGTDITITLPVNSTVLLGSGNDTDGTIALYQWTKISGPSLYAIVTPAEMQTTINNMVQGTYQFELMVTDNVGALAKDTVQVTVLAAPPPPNSLPIAQAGADISIQLPVTTATVTGSGTDTDGTIVSYQWSRVSGPLGYTITSASSSQTSITGLVQGTYGFELKVTDDDGATGKDTVLITVLPAPPPPNQAPAANAGTDQTITLPQNSVSLNGSGTDSDGTIASYLWTKISGPANGSVNPASAAQTAASGLVQGVYMFELKVTDDDGATGKDTVVVLVNPAPNQPPVAQAGADQFITLPINTVTLQGSGNDADGTITTYLWTRISGPSQHTIVSPGSASTVVNNLAQGSYGFELTVTDNSGAVAKDTLFVVVNPPIPVPNVPPVAYAGSDWSVTLPVNTVTLTGYASDPDGVITSYAWSKVSGPSAYSIASNTSAQTTVNGLDSGEYWFRLTVTDNSGATASDTVVITVHPAVIIINNPPVVYAGTDQVITLPQNSVMLQGSATDSDGTIQSVQWTKISGPVAFTLVNANALQTALNGLIQGSYQFELKATDNSGDFKRDTVMVTVLPAANVPPQAYAGTDQSIILPQNSVTLYGSGTDADGTIASYLWSMISGPQAYTISNAGSAQTGVSALVQGVYLFQLTVTDNSGATAKDTVMVTVHPANQLPVASAGTDKIIQLPINSVTLSGSGTDADGSISSYAWTKVSGPSQFNLANAGVAQTILNNLVQGVYLFELKVTDNDGATGKDTVMVTVLAVNQPPVSHAGNDILITLPQSAALLSGSGSDADGTVASYFWSKISGPNNYNLVNISSAQTVVNSLVQGTYLFELKVTDNQGATGRDTVRVTVNPPPNVPPVANAGADQTITLPLNMVTVNGSGSDVDGSVTAYQWTRISGPLTANIQTPTQGITTISALEEGTYKFELKVTDNSGASARDTMTVQVKPDTRTASTAMIYPNPATTTINVRIEAITHRNLTTLKIFDEKGSLVYEEEFLRTEQVMVKTVNVSRLATGIYTVMLNVDINNISSLKFIKH